MKEEVQSQEPQAEIPGPVSRKRQGIFLRILTHNWYAKLMAIIGALLLFFYVDNLKIGLLTLSIPVTYNSRPDSLAYINDPPRFLEIQIRGDRTKLNFPSGKLHADVDLRNAQPGSNLYPVVLDLRSIPDDVEVIEQPSQIRLGFEQSLAGVLFLKPRVTNNPAAGFRKGRISVLPDRVRVVGTKKRLGTVREIALPPIDISGLSATISSKVPITEPDGIRLLDPAEATVTVAIVKDQVDHEKVLEIPVVIRNAPVGLEVSTVTKTAKLRISGSSDNLAEFNQSDAEVILDLTGFDLTGAVESVSLEIPLRAQFVKNADKFTVLSVEPELAQVRFEKKEKTP